MAVCHVGTQTLTNTLLSRPSSLLMSPSTHCSGSDFFPVLSSLSFPVSQHHSIFPSLSPMSSYLSSTLLFITSFLVYLHLYSPFLLPLHSSTFCTSLPHFTVLVTIIFFFLERFTHSTHTHTHPPFSPCVLFFNLCCSSYPK